jgi:excisionase family DNA binding protein
MDPARTYLTYDELHVKTGLSLSTLRRRVKEGRLPFFQPGGPRTRVVFPADVIERLLSSVPIREQPQEPAPMPSSPAGPRGPRPKWLQS